MNSSVLKSYAKYSLSISAYDVFLDTSLNKLHSPSSSITSQRKLEWDSLADVGYANESDRKTSASSLSTLERLALKQQYSNNDTQQNSNLGVPTAHSTPLDGNEIKTKSKKGIGKKSTKIYNKDVDYVEVNVPQSSNMNPAQSINVNLTKHISFNVEKNGNVTVDNIQRDISVSPEKIPAAAEVYPKIKMDRDVQTSLTKATNVLSNIDDNVQIHQKIPILISLNTLKSRVRRRRLRLARRKQKSKKRSIKDNIPVQEKSGEQLSEAESFEYMPGHIYNQNQMTANNRPPNPVDNKSSLESSGVLTSESSKGSKHSFTKDLEKSIDFLKSALQNRFDDSSLRKQLIQQVCQRLLTSHYRDDESTTDFLSGLSFSSKKLGLGEAINTTSSTSDTNNSAEKSIRPKKSILRTDKFNAGSIASTSQSVPNLPVASNSEKLVTSNLVKNLTTSNTDSDVSSKEKNSSDYGVTKTSSEELYKKYLQALKREEAYKKHLKDKEMLLKQKLVCSDSAFKVPVRVEEKPSRSNNKLKDLIHDLTRNNYDDGSGDASKLEGGPSSHSDFNRCPPNSNQRSHSVFTLSSGTDGQNKKNNLKKRLQCESKDLYKPGTSKESHYCCCPHHGNLKFADSSVQVNIKNPCNESCPAMQRIERPNLKSPRKLAKIIADEDTDNLQYVCLCSKNAIQDVPDEFLIYKCSRLNNKGIQLQETTSKSSNEVFVQCNNDTCTKRNIDNIPNTQFAINKSSQTDLFIKMIHGQPNDLLNTNEQNVQKDDSKIGVQPLKSISVYESTRWIQTEISIDPKISEPTLSDINLVSDHNCAKLVGEHCRQVSKPSLTDMFSTQATASSGTALSSSYKSTGSSKNIGNNLNDYNATASNEISKMPASLDHPEKFTIPIYGTNMTLMVSLGSEHTVGHNRNPKEMVTECVGTEKVDAIEQASSVTVECSKGVQSDELTDAIKTNEANNNTIGSDNINIDKGIGTFIKPLMVNPCVTTKDVKFGTYPKICLINDQKPLRRANTDTDKVQSAAFFKNLENVSIQNIKNIIKSKKMSRTTSPDKGSESEKKEHNVCIKEMSTKQLKNEVNLLETRRENCLCGCGGLKDSCRKGCILTSTGTTPSELCHNPASGSQGNTDCKISVSDAQSENCICGCGSIKNMCKKSCKELVTNKECVTQQSKQANEYSTQPIEQSSTVTNISLEQNNTCRCGCGGTRGKCKKTCPDLKLSPRKENAGNKKQCAKQSVDYLIDTQGVQTNTAQAKKYICGKQSVDKEMDTQTDTSMTRKESCMCGCGGSKDRCKKNCRELRSSPRKEKRENNIQCRKRSIDKQINTLTDISSRQNNQYENKCLDKQIDATLIPRNMEVCGKQPLNKEMNTQTDKLLTDYEICSCGCAGPKEKCKLSCKELKSKPLNDSAENKNTFLSPREKCSCGCGGPKDNCQNDCVELKLIPQGQYGKQDVTINTAQGFSTSHKELRSSPRDFEIQTDKKDMGIQKDRESSPTSSRCQKVEVAKYVTQSTQSTVKAKHYENLKIIDSSGDQSEKSLGRGQKSSSETEPTDSGSDPIINMIQSITEKYTKKEVDKNKRKKCFREIMTVLNYLLETDDFADGKEDVRNRRVSTTTADETDASFKKPGDKVSPEKLSKKVLDKGVQLSSKKSKANPCTTESSELLSTDTNIAGTSSNSAPCKVLNKIKKECERFQKRCKLHSGNNCEPSSSTATNCDQCRRVHYCQCRSHKCKSRKKSNEKIAKSPVAYNLILQTSESMMSEGPSSCEKSRKLKNIIVKVPKKKPPECMPFREIAAKFERQMPCAMHCAAHKDVRCNRSRSLPNESEISSMEEIIRQSQGATVREYLEKNRPDFIEKCSQRQTCMRYISETR